MSQEKRKSENYQNLGGINSKASQYVTGPTEFLDLRNVDFQTPGALTSRWGSTQYIGPTYGASIQIQSLFEYERLDGFSQIMFSFSGSLYFGATTGAHQGFSFAGTNFGASSTYSMASASGVGDTQMRMTYGGKVLYAFYTSFYSSLQSKALGQGNYDYAVLNDWTFFCDGVNFGKYRGTTPLAYGLPYPTIDAVAYSGGAAGPVGATNYFLETGYAYNFYANWLNVRGFQSPLVPIGYMNLNQDGATLAALYGGTLFKGLFGFTMIDGYGITALQIWQYRGSLATNQFDLLDTNAQSTVRLMHSFNAGGSLLIIGTTATGQSLIYFGDGWNGSSYMVDGATYRGADGFGIRQVDIAQQYPKYIEVYSNRLFLSGYANAQSTVRFTDVGEPEGQQADWSFEVRTNDGDVIRAKKAYNSRLYIFKENSFHELSGDSPDTFVLREMSDQYGCISNRATAVFNNTMIFLDKKGVCEFNGANTQIISTKVQSFFDRMSISAARNNATMVHDRQRNQVLIGIPVDGATTNNFTVVYDYLVGAWTSHDGFSPAVFAMVKGRNSIKTPMFGNNSGQIMYFGSSFLGDMGTTGAIAFTCIIKTRSLADAGNSIQKQFRRLYLDTNVSGTTSAITVKFMQDHGASIVLTRTMYKDKFQNRIDYGLSAKSLTLQIESADTANALTLSGFTIESRIQRLV